MTDRTAAVNQSGQIVPLDRAFMEVRSMLGQNMKGLSALLGRFMEPERFCGAVLTLCRHNTDLADHTRASRASLLLAVMRVAQLQLSPDPALGQAWIVPRKGKAEFQLGYKGQLALAYRSPLVSAIRFGVVHKADRFVWRDGRQWALEHEPVEEGWPESMDDLRAAWAILETVRGGAVPRVMYKAEILRHKARGSGAQPAWSADPSPMALKTVLGSLCRRGPFEGEMARAFQLDHLGEIGKGQPDDDSIEVPFRVEPNGAEPPAAGTVEAFKAAHAEETGVSLEEEVVEREPGEDDEAPVRDAPELLGERRAGNLLKLASDNRVGEEALREEAVRLCGSADLADIPAALESDLLKFIQTAKSSRPPGRRR